MATLRLQDAAGTVVKADLSIQVGSVSTESDWQARLIAPDPTKPGIEWFVRCQNEAEVDAHRWTPDYGSGNDPLAKGKGATNLRWISTDGVDGHGCMELVRQAGTFEGPNWWRPMSPLIINGVADPGANPLPWKPTDGGGQTNSWENGYYGNPIYTGTVPNSTWQGTEYWFQFRANVDPVRSQQPDYQIQALTNGVSGKFIFQSITSSSLTNQEIVLMNFCSPVVGENHAAAYRSGGPWLMHPGTWQYAQGNWDTIMFHVKPGTSGKADTLIEIYAAHRGEKAFTLIHTSLEQISFDHKNGYNAIIFSNYQNSANIQVPFYLRVCQMIFSKQPIACPQV